MSPRHNNAPKPARVVRLSQPFGLARLFRPLPKTADARPVLDVTYHPKSGDLTLQFSAKEALGIPEQTLLLGLLELAKAQHEQDGDARVLSAATCSEPGAELWRMIRGNGNPDRRSLHLETNWHALNRLYGEQTGGSATATRRVQLKRLCEVTVWERNNVLKTERQSFLVVMLTSDDNRIHLALNARLAAAILEDGYAQISLSERLALHQDLAKAVHAFLSTTVAPGSGLPIGVETLVDRFWPYSDSAVPAKTHTSRCRNVREALRAIDRLPLWTVTWRGADQVEVNRRKNMDVEMTSHIAIQSLSYRHPRMSICPNKINDLQALDASVLFNNRKSV
jgi:hypothetical protein